MNQDTSIKAPGVSRAEVLPESRSTDAENYRWLRCRCGGEVGVPTDSDESYVECPGCGAAVQLKGAVLFRPPAPLTQTPASSLPQPSVAGTSTDTGMAGQARQLLLLRRLNNLKACHQVFAEAQVSSPWVWLLLLAFLALYPVSMGISLLTLPPTGTSGGWGLVIILVTAALLAGAKLFFDRRKEGIVAGAKKHLTKSIDRLCDEFPQEAACWGGSDALWEAQRVRDMIQVVSAKMAAEQPALLQPHRGQVVYALGILGWFLPLLGIVAWILGNSDLEAMNAGKMDRSGYSQTDSGRTLGKAACLLYGALIGIALLVRTNH